MVTKVAGNQGQITLKGVPITDEWQELVARAAKRNGQGFSDFVADVTRVAALAIMKGEPALPAALPARIEDVGATLAEQIAAIAERQDARLDRIERASARARRGRWRR